MLDREEFSMVVSMIEYDSFLGRICTGRIASGTVKVGGGGGGGPCARPVSARLDGCSGGWGGSPMRLATRSGREGDAKISLGGADARPPSSA